MSTNFTVEEHAMYTRCVAALRARAGYLEDNDYDVGTVETVRAAAYWLASDAGLTAVCMEYGAHAPDSGDHQGNTDQEKHRT